MQTILGSGGSIGHELARNLKEYTSDIRLVSRNPKKVNESDELMAADLLDAANINQAVKGSSIVYVTIGFKYNLKVWQQNWPSFMSNVIKACTEHNCKLVFLDNIYMYNKEDLDGMDEETPYNPSSKKGLIRKEVANMILEGIKDGKLTALIARSADFYGPTIPENSVLAETVFKTLSQGKKANWMSSLKFKHSFTYTPDAAKATAILGNTDDAYNQVWHLPTASDPFTGKEWIDEIARELNVTPKIQVAPIFLIRIMGIFSPIMRELAEMMYQYDRDYVFDGSKFEKRFNFKPTSYLEGIKEIVRIDYNK